MKTKETKQFIHWCILGAIGCGLMAAGDWLLGCVPLQKTDTGLFNRACYLSGSYGLWRPVLTVGLGAIGGFLYYFVVKALNADIDEKYRKTRTIQFLCGIFTVAIALTIHTWVATMAWFTTYLGPRIRAEAALAAVTAYQDDMLPAILPMYVPMLLVFGIHFVMLLVFGVFGIGVRGKLRVVLGVVFGIAFVVCAKYTQRCADHCLRKAQSPGENGRH